MTDIPDPGIPDHGIPDHGIPDHGIPDHPTDTENRLRAALAAAADTIEPSGDGLRRIEERLMEDTTASNRNKVLVGIGSVAAALLIGVVAFVAADSDDDDGGVIADSPSSTTTTIDTTTSTTTTETTDTTTTVTEPTFTPDVDPFSVAYPDPLTSQRFDSPESVAMAYSTEVLGFTELVLVEYREGDGRSGEVIITDRPDRLETAVLVRQMEDDTWFALGSQTPDIVVDSPAAGDTLDAPSFDTAGSALAFEGTVSVSVLARADAESLGEGFVTGNGTPPAGPFSGTIEFTAPGTTVPGIIVYRVFSAEDGHVTQATSFPIRLAAG